MVSWLIDKVLHGVKVIDDTVTETVGAVMSVIPENI